jgi:hypothetical protein
LSGSLVRFFFYSCLAYRILLLVKVLSLRHFFQLRHIQGRDPAHKKSSVHIKCGFTDPDPGSGAFLTPGSGMGKKSRSGFRDEHPGSYIRDKQFFGLKILKFLYADSYPGSGIFLTLDPGSWMEKFGSGVRDKHHDQLGILGSDFDLEHFQLIEVSRNCYIMNCI